MLTVDFVSARCLHGQTNGISHKSAVLQVNAIGWCEVHRHNQYDQASFQRNYTVWNNKDDFITAVKKSLIADFIVAMEKSYENRFYRPVKINNCYLLQVFIHRRSMKLEYKVKTIPDTHWVLGGFKHFNVLIGFKWLFQLGCDHKSYNIIVSSYICKWRVNKWDFQFLLKTPVFSLWLKYYLEQVIDWQPANQLRNINFSNSHVNNIKTFS